MGANNNANNEYPISYKHLSSNTLYLQIHAYTINLSINFNTSSLPLFKVNIKYNITDTSLSLLMDAK
jgi:hypothetical protein